MTRKSSLTVESMDDRRMDTAIGNMLRTGVSIAAAFVLTGWILCLGDSRLSTPDYRHFRPEPVSITAMPALLHGVRTLDCRSIIHLGVLLLIATPVLRVVFCVAAFAVRRDFRYVLISAAVLAILLYSLFFRV